MNPNGLVPLLRDDESDLILWNQTPLSAIWRHSTGKNACGRLTGTSCGSRKMDGLGKPDASNAHRGILMGLVRTPPEERVRPPLMPVVKSATPCLPCSMGTGKSKMVLWRRVWCGRYRYAPFIYNLFNVGLTWTPRPNRNAGISNSLNAPQCAKW